MCIMTEPNSSTPKVFLEYSYRDSELGQRIQGILRGKNIPFWNEHRDMAPGDDINDVIDDVLENCTHMIFIWSPYISSERIQILIERAKAKNLKVIPVDTSSRTLPRILGGVRPVRYNTWFELSDQIIHGVLGAPDSSALPENDALIEIVPKKKIVSTIDEEAETAELNETEIKIIDYILRLFALLCALFYIFSFDSDWLVWITLIAIVWAVMRIGIRVMAQNKSEATIAGPRENFKGYTKVREIISDAQEYVYLIDPFPAEETLVALNASKDDVDIQLLTHKWKDEAKQREFEILARKFTAQRPRFEVRIDPKYQLHDRLIITESRAWSVGSSIKDVGNKLSVIIPLKLEDSSEIREQFNTIWNESKKMV